MTIKTKPATKEYLENYDRIFNQLASNKAEEEKAYLDLLAYGTGVTTNDADGVVKHIPLSEFLMEASDEN